MTEPTEHADDQLNETPEDVAILYSWANLHGAKYRDFSASRREYRAQVRHRAAEDLRESELAAKAEAESAAGEAERIAREAERAARASEARDSGQIRDRALREADDAARRAGAERVEAARRAEAAALAEAAARRAEREIAEAHASAQRQAASYTNAEMRRRVQAGPQPVKVPGLAHDPYEVLEHPLPDGEMPSGIRPVIRRDVSQYRDYAHRSSGGLRAYRPELEMRRRPQGYQPDEASGLLPAYRPQGVQETATVRGSGVPFEVGRPDGSRGEASRGEMRAVESRAGSDFQAVLRRMEDRRSDGPAAHEETAPAWLYSSSSSHAAAQPGASQASGSQSGGSQSGGSQSSASPQGMSQHGGAQAVQPTAVPDTLQHSREQVASRWFALKGVFHPGQESDEGARRKEARTPALAVFSLAGGVGKTSLVATLGRALSSLGEKVLLTDTTSHGLLPYYFGASELRPGAVRTFSPPSGVADAPIYLVSYDGASATDAQGQGELTEELVRSAQGTQRVLLDVNAGSGWLVKRLAKMRPTVLVPVAADMNSVISLQAVERYFEGVADSDGRAVQPYYVLNQFDAALPLHLDVREVLKRQLGDRLLPFVVRRAVGVSEALAEGMTVVDYTPEAAISEDYMKIAGWIREVAPTTAPVFRNSRWSER